MTKLFISYRRDDSAGHAGRLFDRLKQHFVPGQSCVVGVQFAPHSGGQQLATLTAVDAGEKALARVPLSGTGTQAQASVTLGKPISLPAAGSATH